MTVTLQELASFLKAPSYAEGAEATLLQTVLDAAIENVESRVGPLAAAEVEYAVRPNGCNLVLPVTHLTSVGDVTDPDGNVIDVDQLDTNLLSGIVSVPYVRRGTWTVAATSTAAGASLKLAVQIIASHLWEVQRGGGSRPGFGQPVTDGAPVRMGFAIPARAAELIAPFRQITS